MLAEDAIKAALSDYRIKQQSKPKEKNEETNWIEALIEMLQLRNVIAAKNI